MRPRSRPLGLRAERAASLCASLLVVAAFSGPARADSVNYAVPESPAFTYIGTSPTKVAHPGTARDLGVDLLNAVDGQGEVVQGFALEVRPWYLVPGLDIPLERYQKKQGFWIFANAQLSIGTTRSTGGTADTDIAFGLRVPLYDAGDPMQSSEYAEKLGKLLLSCAPESPGKPSDPVCRAEKTRPMREEWLRTHWNATRLSVAAATGLEAPGSVLQDTSWSGVSVWAAGSLGISTWGQVLAQVQYDHRKVPDPASAFPDEDDIRVGARAFFGSAVANGFVELSLLKSIGGNDGAVNNPISWSGGVEFRVSDQAWVSTGFGSNFPRGGEKYPVLVIANLRWAVADHARIK